MIWVSCFAPFIPVVLIALWGKIELFFRRLKRRFFPKKKQNNIKINENVNNETKDINYNEMQNKSEINPDKNKIE